MPSGSLLHPEILAQPTANQHIQQIAGDVRLARNIGLAFLFGKMVPGLFVLWMIWLFFFRH